MTPYPKLRLRFRTALTLVISISAALFMIQPVSADSPRRVPAEWEPQAGVWLQWPGPWERSYENAFARIASVIVRYQPLHILYSSKSIQTNAEEAIKRVGADPAHENIHWHAIPYDSAWMRDNGPVYVEESGKLKIQNWGFDAWGGAFGASVPFRHDNAVPLAVAELAGLETENIEVVHERGNLEFNGVDTVLLNWSVLGDPRRNKDYTKAKAEQDLKRHFGVARVVFIEGVPMGDLTNGHIDGIARFINPTTVVVGECIDGSKCSEPDHPTRKVFDAAAGAIAAAGLDVIRDPIETSVEYRGEAYDTNYLNWLIGNGYVITTGFGNKKADRAAKARLESYFPGREVYVIDMLESWAAGGGVHCHTNDMPAIAVND